MYTFISAIKSVFRNKFINLTVTASLALGMLFPMLVFCIGNVVLREIWANIATYPERTAGVFSDDKIRIDTEKAMSDYPQIEVMVEGSFAEHDYIVSGGKIVKTQTAGYKACEDKIIGYDMLYGRYFTEEESNGNERICIISSNLQRELGCNAGDTVVLGNEEFTVKGVYINRNIALLMPLDTFSQKYRTEYAYNILFKKGCDVKTEGMRIIEELLNEYGIDNTHFMLMSDYYVEHNDLKNAYFALAIMLAIASVVLIYAALNISNIMVNKINTDMKNYTIKMQLGAKKGNIFGFLWVQLIVLMLISVGIDAAAVLLLKNLLPFFAGFSFDLDPLAVLLTALIGAAYVLVLSSALVKRIYKERKAA